MTHLLALLATMALAANARPSRSVDPPRQLSGAAADTGALTRAQVMAILAGASDAHPADFTGHDLSGLDLSGLVLNKANFSDCRLVGTKFVNAKMFAANLDRAVAQHADFSGATLDIGLMRGTDLTGAVFHGASLYAVIMTGANFTDADLTNARLIATAIGALFTRAKLAHADVGADPRNQPMGLMRTDWTNVDLSGADLSDANLRKVKLTRANLTGANLTNADLTGADLTDAVFHKITGRSSIKGLDQAHHVEDAHFDP
jgi:uncharacterized protein YjbI with pentapeptide repeats